MKQKSSSSLALSNLMAHKPSPISPSLQQFHLSKPISSTPLISIPSISQILTPSSNNPQSHRQMNNNPKRIKKSTKQTSQVGQISINSKVEQNIYGKIQKLLNRTNDIEKKLKKHNEVTPKGKALVSKFLTLSSKSIKNSQQYDSIQNQQQSVQVSPFTPVSLQSLSPIWKLVIEKQVNNQEFLKDCNDVLEIVSEWKIGSEKFQKQLRRVEEVTGMKSIAELVERNKLSYIRELVIVEKEEEIEKLNQKINCLESERSTLISQSSKITSSTSNPSYINSCYSPTSSKRFSSLPSQNAQFCQTISRLQFEKLQLTQTLESQIALIKSTITQQVQSKLQLTKDLFAAQNYIAELKKTNQLQVSTLQQIIERERESMERFMEAVKNEAVYRESVEIRGLEKSISLSRLQMSVEEQIRCKEYLGRELVESKEEIQELEKEKESILNEIKRINDMIKQYQEVGNSNQDQSNEHQIDQQIKSLSFGVKYFIQKYKILKSQIKSSHPSSPSTPFNQIQQSISSTSKQIILKNPRFQHFYSNQSKFNRRNALNPSTTIQSLQKQNKRKPFQRVVLPLQQQNKTIVESRRNKTQKQTKNSNVTFVEQDSVNSIQHLTNLSNSYKKKASLLLQSLNNSRSVQQQLYSEYGNTIENNDDISEISECWKQCQSIKNFAMRSDNQSPNFLKIDDLFEKYNLSGQIALVIKKFIRRITQIVEFDKIKNEIDVLGRELRDVIELDEFDRGNEDEWMNEQLGKMGEIFDCVNMQIGQRDQLDQLSRNLIQIEEEIEYMRNGNNNFIPVVMRA